MVMDHLDELLMYKSILFSVIHLHVSAGTVDRYIFKLVGDVNDPLRSRQGLQIHPQSLYVANDLEHDEAKQ